MAENSSLIHIQGVLTESLIPITEHLIGFIANPYIQAYQEIIEILNTEDIPAVDVISDAIKFKKLRSIKTETETNIIESANILMGIYAGLIEMGILVYNDESLVKYTLTEDSYVTEKNKFIIVFKDDINLFYNELNELERLQRDVSNQFQNIKPYMSNDTDWGDLAAKFGKGALAGMAPWIGVPALIHDFWSSHKKDQKIDIAFEQFDEKWQDYLEQWDSTFTVMQNVFSSTIERIKSKVDRDLIHSTLKYCSILSSKGHDLERYFSNLREEISDLEQKFYGE